MAEDHHWVLLDEIQVWRLGHDDHDACFDPIFPVLHSSVSWEP